MTAIFVVRHGNTFAAGEPPRRIGCRTDLMLTAEGCAQATAVGRWFAKQGIAFCRAYYGPLRRTTDTARRILAEQGRRIPAAPAAMLNEIDHGVDENQPELLVEARLGAAALRRWDEEGIAPADWTVDRESRIAWWRSLFEQRYDETILVVTSNGAARFALAELEGRARPGRLKLRTGAFGLLANAGTGTPFRCVQWDVRAPSAPVG